MNTELIKIVTNENGKQLVNARDLYIGLKFDDMDNFSRWIKKQLENVDATENIDFIKTFFKEGLSKTGQTKTDYALTIETAKEICMVVGTSPRANSETKSLSKKFRKYFIECEKKLQEVQQPKQMSDMEILARAVLISDKQIKELQAELSEKTEFIDEINDCYTFADVKRKNRLLLSRRKDIILSTHTLIETAQSLGIPVNKVQNPNPCSAYTVINAYPRKVWETAYPELVLPEKEMR